MDINKFLPTRFRDSDWISKFPQEFSLIYFSINASIDFLIRRTVAASHLSNRDTIKAISARSVSSFLPGSSEKSTKSRNSTFSAFAIRFKTLIRGICLHLSRLLRYPVEMSARAATVSWLNSRSERK